jgi:hypothetical protein
MEEISWTDRVGNEEVLQRVRKERSGLRKIKRRKANLIGHTLRRNCLLKHIIEGKIVRPTYARYQGTLVVVFVIGLLKHYK